MFAIESTQSNGRTLKTAKIVYAGPSDGFLNASDLDLIAASNEPGVYVAGTETEPEDAADDKIVSRRVFESWTPAKRMEHIKSGGTLTD